jgi:hypothetical protein
MAGFVKFVEEFGILSGGAQLRECYVGCIKAIQESICHKGRYVVNGDSEDIVSRI